ncbi:MAG: peptidase M14, partial [Deltaproteobacteria bacterium]|nr:peptidase M14 [Deltaproteobacteria bacterium]
DWVPLEGFPDVLRPRRLEDPPPYFRLYPEGLIEGFDGHTVPEPHYLSDNDTDLNRNFPADWQHPTKQAGAGPYALSAPESRAVVAFASKHPNIFAWANLHCFGGVLIRPPGSHPDAKMDPDELALYRQLGIWSEALTDYPAVSGFEEFTYTPDEPLHGDLTAWAHEHQGAFAWVVELWDLFKRLGIPRPKRFVDYYDRLGDDELARLAEFDRDHNASRIFCGWTPAQHPQLGPVECGGFAPLVGIWNPPYEKLAELVDQQAALAFRVATMAPRLDLDVKVDGVHVTMTARNLGYLGTHFVPSARKNPVAEPLWLELHPEGTTLAPGQPTRHLLGHLDGWGRGHLNPGQSILGPRSPGNSHEATRTLAVTGPGRLRIKVGSSRVGWIETTIDIA